MILKHYGIKGMHWGIRRYQNEDGSLTAEGKKHYRIDSPRVAIDWDAKRKRDEQIRNPFKIKTKEDSITKVINKSDEIFGKRYVDKNIVSNRKKHTEGRAENDWERKNEELYERNSSWYVKKDVDAGRFFVQQIFNDIFETQKSK